MLTMTCKYSTILVKLPFHLCSYLIKHPFPLCVRQMVLLFALVSVSLSL